MASADIPRLEMLQVADMVAREKSIEREEVLEAMEQAIQKAGRAKYGLEHDIRAEIDRKTGRAQLCLFVPATPNPTSGFIFLAPADEVIELEMSVDEAITYLHKQARGQVETVVQEVLLHFGFRLLEAADDPFVHK